MDAPNRIRFLIGLFALALAAGVESALAVPARGDTGWPEYNGGYNSQRFSPLKQINTGNVAGLKPVCEVKLGEEGAFESGPIVVDDVLYVTTAHTTVAMDASDCTVLWRNIHTARSAMAPTARAVSVPPYRTKPRTRTWMKLWLGSKIPPRPCRSCIQSH